jgi:hypothetical protein
MIFYVRNWLLRGKFVLVFVVLTYMLYHFLLVVTEWIQPAERYKEPFGKSVKVFHNHVSMTDRGPMGERLKLFYWLGE